MQETAYPANSWKQIGDRWYFFDAQGYTQTGWIQWESEKYYCSENGSMLTSCMTADNYWIGKNGVKIAQQCEVNNKSRPMASDAKTKTAL